MYICITLKFICINCTEKCKNNNETNNFKVKGLWCLLSLSYVGIYIYISGVFKGNSQQVKEYQDLLAPVLHHTMEGIYKLYLVSP